jgi:hypothetical protein
VPHYPNRELVAEPYAATAADLACLELADFALLLVWLSQHRRRPNPDDAIRKDYFGQSVRRLSSSCG